MKTRYRIVATTITIVWLTMVWTLVYEVLKMIF